MIFSDGIFFEVHLQVEENCWETMTYLQSLEGCAAEQMTAVGYELATDAPPVSTLTRRIWKLRHRVSQVAQIARGQIQASGRAHVELKPAT